MSILLDGGGTGGIVEVRIDGGAPSSMAAIPGASLDFPGITAHAFEITVTTTVPAPLLFWAELSYDHNCL